jgi:hypothetical protein
MFAMQQRDCVRILIHVTAQRIVERPNTVQRICIIIDRILVDMIDSVNQAVTQEM